MSEPVMGADLFEQRQETIADWLTENLPRLDDSIQCCRTDWAEIEVTLPRGLTFTLRVELHDEGSDDV